MAYDTDPMFEEFYRTFMEEVGTGTVGADGDDKVAPQSFTEKMCEFLVDQGCAEDLTPAFMQKTWKTAILRVDAYHFDSDSGELTLVISDFSFSAKAQKLSDKDVQADFDRLERFFHCALDT